MTALPELPVGYSPVPAGHLAAVVTHLEMLAQPEPRDLPPLAHSLALTRIAAGDVDAYRRLFRKVGEEWLWFSRLRLTDDELAAILADEAVEAYAVCDGPEAIGLVELDFRTAGECELAFFGLASTHTGHGAGRWLMQEATRRAWAHGISRFHVHTCTLDHPAAVAFYVRSGFVPYKREVEIAPDPRLTGELPRAAGAHAPVIE